MLAAILTVLALAGGVAVTFFIMDAPRRRAAELRLRLTDELDAVAAGPPRERRAGPPPVRPGRRRAGRGNCPCPPDGRV